MNLTPELLLSAYQRGIFPMAHQRRIYWYDPDPRGILPLDQFHVSHSLQRALKRVRVEQEDGSQVYLWSSRPRTPAIDDFVLTINRDFPAVITHCADPRRPGAWIDQTILNSYIQLHQAGHAHSIETWQNGQLVGGLYGVSLKGLFAGEAMFSQATNASKVALVYLVHHLRERGFVLLDVQFHTTHLSQFGVIEVPRATYQQLLAQALMVSPTFAPHK